MGLPYDGRISHTAAVDRSGPAVEIDSVEHFLKAFGVAPAQPRVRLDASDFPDEKLSPANFPTVSLQLNGSRARNR